MRNIFLLLFLLSQTAIAETSLHAHEHGSLILEISVEGKIVSFSIDGAAESFLGFEHLAKTTKDKKTYENVKDLWNKNFLELVSFDKKLNCNLVESKFEQVKSEKEKGNHSDVEASAKVECQNPLKTTSLYVNLKRHFKKIRNLKIDLVGDSTKSLKVDSDHFEIKL